MKEETTLTSSLQRHILESIFVTPSEKLSIRMKLLAKTIAVTHNRHRICNDDLAADVML